MNSILTWAIAGNRAGYATRLLDLPALMSLALERRLADRFVPQLRREVFEALASAPRNSVSIEEGFLRIGLAGICAAAYPPQPPEAGDDRGGMRFLFDE